MITGLLGTKVGMTHYFGDEGRLVPVTVLRIGPCVVTQVRTQANDGYEAVQLGYGGAKQVNRPKRGHLGDLGNLRHLREFPTTDLAVHRVGQQFDVTEFRPGELVDVTGTSKGKGFQGVVRRHNYSGGPKTHGQKDRHRAIGSIGAGTYPGRVVKGKPMPGHMGNERVTVRNIRVERVLVGQGLLLVRGAVPGAPNSLVTVRHTELDEAKLPPRVEAPAAEEPVDEPAEAVEEEQVEAAPAEAPAEEPVAEAEETPADESTEAPAEEAVAEADETSADESAEAPAEEAVAEADETPADESAEAPAEEPVAEVAPDGAEPAGDGEQEKS
jgi:large subunit ribosomal protein L3